MSGPSFPLVCGVRSEIKREEKNGCTPVVGEGTGGQEPGSKGGGKSMGGGRREGGKWDSQGRWREPG